MGKNIWKVRFLVLLSLIMFSPVLVLPSLTHASDKPIILKFGWSIPGKASLALGWDWWCKEVEKRTNGRVKIEAYPGRTLAAAQTEFDSVVHGIADISMVPLGVITKRFPLSNFLTLPTLSFPNTYEGYIAAGEAFQKIHDQFTDISDEFKQCKLLIPEVGGAQILVTRKKEIHFPSDLKGVKIAGGAGVMINYAEALGAVPVMVAPPEIYLALEKGVVAGSFLSWSHVHIFKLHEIVNRYFDLEFSQEALPICFNWNSWNRLPKNVQKIMTDLVPEARKIGVTNMLKTVVSGQKSVDEKKLTVVIPTKEERSLWEKSADGIINDWIAEMKDKGAKNPEEIIQEWKRLREKARLK